MRARLLFMIGDEAPYKMIACLIVVVACGNEQANLSFGKGNSLLRRDTLLLL